MRLWPFPRLALLALSAAVSAHAMPAAAGAGADELPRLPWRQAGLTERQTAVHLLDRFTYGPRPGEVDEVVALGLERWLAKGWSWTWPL